MSCGTVYADVYHTWRQGLAFSSSVLLGSFRFHGYFPPCDKYLLRSADVKGKTYIPLPAEGIFPQRYSSTFGYNGILLQYLRYRAEGLRYGAYRMFPSVIYEYRYGISRRRSGNTAVKASRFRRRRHSYRTDIRFLPAFVLREPVYKYHRSCKGARESPHYRAQRDKTDHP